MKKCSKCGEFKDLSEFNKKKKSLNYYCKTCNSAYLKEHYKKNRWYYHKKKRDYQSRLVERFKLLKSSLSCNRCGEDHISCLDFHHSDPSKKEFSLSQAAWRCVGWERILSEINKCDVLCANCHRKEHYTEGKQ